MQGGGAGRHQGAGLETPQQLLVVPTQPLLLSVLLLHGLVEVGVLLRQLPGGAAAEAAGVSREHVKWKDGR